ncbi:hypothetical protein INT45_012560 [Circinella minor]|uniref:Uncharacterized protein n=1 Tax=Circinella minor TaxID=1195481 RepID=A0A8H7S383_9FUNG|nr:hypothetical protein INT45_012560 [Circinella minor]
MDDEGVVEAQDPYHIVDTDFDGGKNGIRSLVSLTRAVNNLEKHEVELEESEHTRQNHAMERVELNSKLRIASNQNIKKNETSKRGRPNMKPKKEVTNPRGSSRKYTDEFIVELIDTIQNVTLSAAGADRVLRVPERSTQTYYARFRDGEPYLPSQPQEKLREEFQVYITQSGLQKTSCEALWTYHEKSYKNSQIFNLHLKRSFGRSRRGTPAKAVVSNNRGVNISILGAIAAEGVVNLSLRKPQAVTGGSKKRKTEDGEQRLVSKLWITHTSLVQETVAKRGFQAGVKRELLTKADLTPRIVASAH